MPARIPAANLACIMLNLQKYSFHLYMNSLSEVAIFSLIMLQVSDSSGLGKLCDRRIQKPSHISLRLRMGSVSGDFNMLPTGFRQSKAVLAPYTKQIVQKSVLHSFLDIGSVRSGIASIMFGTTSEVIR